MGVMREHILFDRIVGEITLMLEENGFGKTVILEIIKTLFDRNFFYFTNISELTKFKNL
jgi:ABC-type Na+ transport system ATPase subunit NatA